MGPAPVASAVLLIAASRGTPGSSEFGIVAALAIGCAVLLPRLYIDFGVHRGWFSDPNLPRREERMLPLAIGAACVLAAMLLVHVAGGGEATLKSLSAMAFVLAIALCVTRVWKISIHVAAMAGAVIITIHLLGIACMLLVPLVLVVAWSRLELGEHTLPQVGAGAVVGIVGSAEAYWLMPM